MHKPSRNVTKSLEKQTEQVKDALKKKKNVKTGDLMSKRKQLRWPKRTRKTEMGQNDAVVKTGRAFRFTNLA